MTQENIPKLYNKQTGKKVPSVQGVVESAAAIGRYQATPAYDRIAEFLRELVRYAKNMAGIRFEDKKPDSLSEIKSHIIPKTTEDMLRDFIEQLTSSSVERFALAKMLERYKDPKHAGLEIRLQGQRDEEVYFVNRAGYRLNRGENVVLYSEFLPDGFGYEVLGSERPENSEHNRIIPVNGLQVVDSQGVLFSDIPNPQLFVFSDAPPKQKKLNLNLEIKK